MLIAHPTSSCDVCLERYAWDAPATDTQVARPHVISCGHVFCHRCASIFSFSSIMIANGLGEGVYRTCAFPGPAPCVAPPSISRAPSAYMSTSQAKTAHMCSLGMKLRLYGLNQSWLRLRHVLLPSTPWLTSQLLVSK